MIQFNVARLQFPNIVRVKSTVKTKIDLYLLSINRGHVGSPSWPARRGGSPSRPAQGPCGLPFSTGVGPCGLPLSTGAGPLWAQPVDRSWSLQAPPIIRRGQALGHSLLGQHRYLNPPLQQIPINETENARLLLSFLYMLIPLLSYYIQINFVYVVKFSIFIIS